MSANNFKLTLDTIAPAGSFVNTQSVFANNSVAVSLNTDGASYMKVWITSATATVSSIPNDVDWIPASSTWTAVFGNGDNDNNNYKINAAFMDDVGNVSQIVHSGTYIYDTIAPSMSTNCYAYDSDDSTSKTYTNAKTFRIHIEAKDEGAAPTGLQKVEIACSDFSTSPVTIQASSFNTSTTAYGSASGYDGDLTFKSSAVDGQKTITLTAYDNAGNTSTKTIQIYLDTAISSVTTTLKPTAASENQLDPYIKASNNSFVALIETDATDIVEYQLYGDIEGTGTTTSSTWKTYTKDTGEDYMTISGLSFTTDTDGTKSVNVKLKDRAGNISTAPVVTRVYDSTVPAVTISRGNEWIAAGNGTTNNTTISYTASDVTSGLASVAFDCNGSDITGVSGGSFSFSSSTPGATTGANVITITATDNAGNTNTASVTVYIEASFTINSLTLAGYELYSAIYRADTKNNISVTVTNTTPPGSGRYQLYVWCSNTANDEAVAANTSDISWTSGSQDVSSSSINKAGFVSNSAQNNLHVKAVSNVGNVAFAHISFTIDERLPTFNVSASSVVNTRTNTISITDMADETPGQLDKMQVVAKSGTILTAGATNGWVAASDGNISATLSDTLSSGKNYGVTITVRDKAGNTFSRDVTWEYDAVAPEGTIALTEADGSTAKPSPSAVNTFKVIITYDADSTDSYSELSYRIWGDFALTEGGAQVTKTDSWQPMTGNTTVATLPTSGNSTTSVFYCTPNGSGNPNGLDKTIQCELKDNAGNIKAVESAIFRYNPNRALITLQNISSRRISCVHQYRKTSSGNVVSDAADYADQVSFSITCDQEIDAIKVAAYNSSNLPDSQAAGDSVTPITALSGSNGQNYTASAAAGSHLTLPINVIIDGKDYRAALGGSDQTNVDGTHYVIVFGRNLAGVWSIVGTLEV